MNRRVRKSEYRGESTMNKDIGAPVSYFLVNPDGMEEVRNLQKDLHSFVETLQRRMEELKEAIPLEKKLFTLQEAAKYLAVSESFLRKDCSEGPRENRTPGPDPVRLGDMIRYTREDLDAWIDKHKKQRTYLT
jgi:predicted DNA-binding transcriptional regulator AlpA